MYPQIKERWDASRPFLVAGGVALGVFLSARMYRYYRLHSMRTTVIAEVRESIIPSKSQVLKMKSDFMAQMEAGLKKDVEVNGRHLLMLPTYITQLPDGSETGDVFAIDVGGTNFRVMHVRLSKDRSAVESEDSVTVSIPEKVYKGEGRHLFDFFASHVKHFMECHSMAGSTTKLPILGFCFSFPMKQTALNEGILIDWTKGFTCTGVVGEDPVRLLSEALRRAGRPCDVRVVVNDTVGVLAAQRYVNPDTQVGVIIGTGTNACYVEQLSNLTKWSPGSDGAVAGGQTVVNIEWGAFYSEALPRCPEDIWVDAATHHSGKYIFEKLISGMFLGSVARRLLLRMAESTWMFRTSSFWGGFGPVPPLMYSEGSFTTADLCAIAEDRTKFLETTAKVLTRTFGIKALPLSTRRMAQKICLLVAERSALLLAMALDALLTQTGWSKAPESVTIAFDGGVYEKFGLYRDMLLRSLISLMGAEACHFIHLAKVRDGSCMGAAVLAAAAAASSSGR